MNVPENDLPAQYASIKHEIDACVASVFQSQQFILGHTVEECERLVAEYCGSKYACGVSSGTDALLLSLLAEGIGSGDEVITTPYTFVATASAIVRAGATPVFVDIERESLTLDPAKITQCITAKTKAILPVHLFGQMADMQALSAVAAKHHLTVIEDAAQAIGAHCDGKYAGSRGEYGCLSFFPSKNLGCAGDGGMVLTSDAKRLEKLRLLRTHGLKDKTEAIAVGGNFRLDALQAAVLNVKIKHLKRWTEARAHHADRYDRLLQESGLTECGVTLPLRGRGVHVWNQYVIRTPRRDAVHRYLGSKNIASRIYYALPLHLHAAFPHTGHGHGDFPESEKAAAETLALPMYPELSDAQAEYVVASLCDALKKA